MKITFKPKSVIAQNLETVKTPEKLTERELTRALRFEFFA